MAERPKVASDSDELVRESEQRRANEEWLERHREELLDEYAGKYIAVLDERVIAEDPDFLRLLVRLDREHPTVDVSTAAIRFLGTPELSRRPRR